MKEKVYIGMSGGVDSSVAAYILNEQGYEVTGFTMQLCDNLLDSKNQAETNAESVAKRIGIPFEVIDKQEEFRTHVVESFIADYEQGRTPNPCIECNRYLKFCIGHDMIATGHYAIVSFEDYNGEGERWCLKKSTNLAKDQSYFLYTLSQETLGRVVFPLGNMTKEEVRKIAEEQSFESAHQKDSQDICFIPDGNHTNFIENYTEKESKHGNFVDQDGNILGEHKGIIKYTIGQRKGLGLALKRPMYVYKLDVERNEVVLSYEDELFQRELMAEDFNWVSMAEPSKSFRALGRIRYRHKEAPCTVTPLSGGKVSVVFDEPQRAITAGQSLVLFDLETDTYVLGGGKIK